MTPVSSRAWRPAIVLASCLALPGCRNPLATSSDEYGPRVDRQRLRSAAVLPLQESAAPEAEPPPLGERRPDLFEGVERLQVSLEQCRAWTLENNLDLKVVLIDPQVAGTLLSEEEAQFEALFVASISGSDADPSQAEVFRDLFVRPFELDAGVEIPLRSGGRATVSLLTSREESFSGLNPTPYASDLELTLNQPLLRGAGRWANTHQIRIAALGAQIAEAQTKLEVIRQIAEADRAYWLLHEATSVLSIRQQQYEQAMIQLEEARARFRGLLSPEIEVVRAEAGVSRRLSGIIIAELFLRDRQRNLKRIMNHPQADVDSPVMLELSSRPAPVRYLLDAGQLLEAALRERMELLELELRLAQDWSTIDFTKNQRLPLCTLDYVYRAHGAAGSFGRSLEGAANWDTWGWQLGVNMEVPLGNEAAEARVHRAILARLQRLATREARQQAIKQEVLAALDNLELSWQRIAAARQNVILEERNYRAEQGQYRLGLRNSTEVLDAETRQAEARVQLIEAEVDYQIAQVDLAFATGMLLGAARVGW